MNNATATHPLRAGFAFLEQEAGFTLAEFIDTPRAFDNCVARYTSTADGAPALELRIERDRGQVFVELRRADGPWEDKDAILQRLGIARSRHANDAHGAWTGYQLSVQADDVRRHLPLLRQYVLRPA